MIKQLSSFYLCAALGVLGSTAQNQNVELSNILYHGPVEIYLPLMIDSVDIYNMPFDINNVLDKPFSAVKSPATAVDTVLILGGAKAQLHTIDIPIRNSRYAVIDLNVEGTNAYNVYVDGNKSSRNLKLKPGTWDISLSILTMPETRDTVTLALSSPQAQYISSFNPGVEKRAYTLDDVIYTRHINSIDVSPSGKYALAKSSMTRKGQKSRTSLELIDLSNGKSMGFLPFDCRWLENEDLLCYSLYESDGSLSIRTMDPLTWTETVLASNVPDGEFSFTPDKRRLIYETSDKGPSEDRDIYRIVNPEDRQPGWRQRSGLALFDIQTGAYIPLTFGNKNIMLQDIHPDGDKLLLISSRHRFEKRPTTVFSLYELNLNDMSVDTLVFDDGFITGAFYSPDGSQLLITGSPEALNGIGKNVPEGRIPNMTEGEFFIMDRLTGEVSAPTKYFNPSVQRAEWNKGSDRIFFTAEDKDKESLFCYNPADDTFSNMNVPEDIVKDLSIAANGSRGAVIAESAVNPEALYVLELKKNKPQYRKLRDTGEALLAEAALATVVDRDFVNSRGDTINGRYYLPPNFDPNKKYPLIVNYYGGCSPTGRNFATRYPHHLYANNGYVVYVINPSGATGFGQEFASRHVNTAGDGVAQDIIEGTTKLVEELPFIDREKIGCIGASYGGFMTQYLQTVTDLFAAAVSHAGISDHTSYWGNGYWGYSYSEVSMADSYPWTDTHLYVEQSPLFNADKINTPILFVHGDSDTNVPPAESLQLFTALKLLGKDTALVEVSGQNHHIMDPVKRTKWQDTILAWFAKYLQDDPTWWDEMYPAVPY